jgi:hypothetical protein
VNTPLLMRLVAGLLGYGRGGPRGPGLAGRPAGQDLSSSTSWWAGLGRGGGAAVEGRYVATAGIVVKERARRIVLGMHEVDVGSARWPIGWGGEDVGVELDESLEALQEQVDEARGHAPLLVIG